MKELDVVKIDEKEYYIVQEIKKDNTSYIYLSNVDDTDDTLIRKANDNDPDLFLPLDSEDEFELACNLFLNEIFAD